MSRCPASWSDLMVFSIGMFGVNISSQAVRKSSMLPENPSCRAAQGKYSSGVIRPASNASLRSRRLCKRWSMSFAPGGMRRFNAGMKSTWIMTLPMSKRKSIGE